MVIVGFATRATPRRETVLVDAAPGVLAGVLAVPDLEVSGVVLLAVLPARRGVVAAPGFGVCLRDRAVAEDELDDEDGLEGPAVLCESDEPGSA